MSVKMMRVPAYFGRVVAPHVVVALARARRRAARRLEPRVLVGGVVDDQLGDHAQAAPVRLAHERAGSPRACRSAGGRCGSRRCRSRRRLQRRRIERQQPDRVDAEVLDVVELLRQAAEVADAVVVAVEERLDVQLVDDRVLVPERVVGRRRIGGVAAVRRRRGGPCGVSQEVVEVALGAHAACARGRRAPACRADRARRSCARRCQR